MYTSLTHRRTHAHERKQEFWCFLVQDLFSKHQASSLALPAEHFAVVIIACRRYFSSPSSYITLDTGKNLRSFLRNVLHGRETVFGGCAGTGQQTHAVPCRGRGGGEGSGPPRRSVKNYHTVVHREEEGDRGKRLRSIL